MIAALTVAAAVSGLLAIAADWEERRHRSFFLLKPLTTLLIIGIATTAPLENTYTLCVLLALVLSLIGDVFLMFGDGARTSDRAFVAGLASFLLAHVAFVWAFLQGIQAPALPGWLAVIVFLAAGYLFVMLPRAGVLKLPVLVYTLVLAAMVFAAAARHASIGDDASLRALLGALLFMVSDALLGWRRFGKHFRYAQAAILSTYWGAIGLIAGSA